MEMLIPVERPERIDDPLAFHVLSVSMPPCAGHKPIQKR